MKSFLTRFADITTLAPVRNLQKGHGVALADLDNDGDEDIYIEMGGAYEGDSYENSLYFKSGAKQQSLDKYFVGRSAIQQGGDRC